MLPHALAALAAAALSAASDAAPRRVAVLDFTASWGAQCVAAAPATDAQREACEVLRAFADQARLGALAVLRPPGYVVMTRENSAQILKDMGGSCAEGECEVETARLLGASVVVSGEVLRLAETWVVSLKIHDVDTGALLGGGNAQAKSTLEAFGNVRAETERALRGAVGLGGAVVAPAPPAPADPPPRFEPPPVLPAPRDPEPPARPWYAEVRAGDALVAQDHVDPHTDASFHRVAFGARIGRRLSDRFRLEAALGLIGASTGSASVPDGVVTVRFDAGWTFAAAAAWAPFGNRFLSLAAEVGGVTMEASAWIDAGAEVRDAAEAVYWALEARLDVPFAERWYAGARLGVLFAPLSFYIWLPYTGGAVTIDKGISFTPVSLAAGYRF